MSDFYFAYGSNMNPARVEQRQMQFETCLGGVLPDYRLAFNKRSVKYPGAASANVVPHGGREVEGVLYRLSHPSQIEVMDPYEGYPVRYSRSQLPVVCEGDVVRAWVYLANREFIVEGLKPARWYLDHLLSARPYLSADYFATLAGVECLPNSDVEPR